MFSNPTPYNFYPGPSRVYPQLMNYFQEAVETGILAQNHRSSVFESLFSMTKSLLKAKLNIPLAYEIIFVSSATECWEIISQSFVKSRSFHLYNGAFGEKWFQYAHKINPFTSGLKFDHNTLPDIDSIKFNAELIALTHNETSNGAALPLAFQQKTRKQYANHLIAYDATSSMAAYNLAWENGDIWFASVQKGFGLPAGMALMVVSPAAVAKAKAVGDAKYYNSFNFILENAVRNQTHLTPNILNIFLLNRLLQHIDNMKVIDQHLQNRNQIFLTFINAQEGLDLLIKSTANQSYTVNCISAAPQIIKELKAQASSNGFLLGNGYADLNETTLRIANFPAIPDKHFNQLMNFFTTFFKSD